MGEYYKLYYYQHISVTFTSILIIFIELIIGYFSFFIMSPDSVLVFLLLTFFTKHISTFAVASTYTNLLV